MKTQRGGDDDLAFYRFVVESVPIAVATVDSEFRITSFNAWAEKLTGYQREEVLGRSCGEVFRGGRCGAHCPLKSVFEKEAPLLQVDSTVVTKTGETLPVKMSTAGLYDEHGRLLGGLESFQDIRKLKEMEQEQQNLLSMLAHDMKAPVVGIRGFAMRLLKKADPDEKTAQWLRTIDREARNLEGLVEDFLEFARMQAGSLQLNFEATSVDVELQQVLEAYQVAGEKKGVRLEFQPDDGLPIIFADAPRVRRALANLVDNAVKYSGPGERIVLCSREIEQGIVLEVTDEGRGIDPEDIPHIFEPFHRGKRVANSQGSGVGLAAVKAIVEGHGGHVSVASQPGQGTRFTVFLPRDGQGGQEGGSTSEA